MKTAAVNQTSHADSSGARLMAADGRTLPLKGARLRGEA